MRPFGKRHHHSAIASEESKRIPPQLLNAQDSILSVSLKSKTVLLAYSPSGPEVAMHLMSDKL